MVARTVTKSYVALEGEFLEKVLYVEVATAADTVDITDYIAGKTLADVQLFNMYTAAPVTASVNTSTDVITIGANHTAGKELAINIRLI